MLACAQDLFFKNDTPRQDAFNTASSTLQHINNTLTSDSFEQPHTKDQHAKLNKKTHMIPHRSEKDKEEQVWPPEVESAFIEALETIPKLGRRKILVNGKPCGRNELISDFIFRKTSKVRTRKQVSSHIQVLKNTRKNDPHFMHLLTDSVDMVEDFTHRKTPKTAGKRPQLQQQQQHQHNQQHQQPQQQPHQQQQQQLRHQPSACFLNQNGPLSLGKLATLTSAASISSDESSIHSSPSPADYVFDMMCTDDHALSMLDIKDPFYDSLAHPLFDATTLGISAQPSSSEFTSAASSDMPMSSASSGSISSSTPVPDALVYTSSNCMQAPLLDTSCFDLPSVDINCSESIAPMFSSNGLYDLQQMPNDDHRLQPVQHTSHDQQFQQNPIQQQPHHYQHPHQQHPHQQPHQQHQHHQHHQHQHSHRHHQHQHQHHHYQQSLQKHQHQEQQQQLPNADMMSKSSVRSFGQPRKWKRGPKRQKHTSARVATQQPRKANQHYDEHRTPSSSASSASSSSLASAYLGFSPLSLPSSTRQRQTNSPFTSTSLPTTAATEVRELSTTLSHTLPSKTFVATDTSLAPMATIPSPSYPVSLWPSYLCLYLESTSGYDGSNMVNSHTLAQLPHCFPVNKSSRTCSVSDDSTLQQRYSSLTKINPTLSLLSSDITLFAKMKLDLNFNMNDFFFNNTCFFESRNRRMIECTTTIYSFDKVVLESKEMQQALWVDEGKYMYSFVYVNQFFDAFMKGIRSLKSWEDVDIAIHNLCIVQVFEDMEAKCQEQDYHQQDLDHIVSASVSAIETNAPANKTENSPALSLPTAASPITSSSPKLLTLDPTNSTKNINSTDQPLMMELNYISDPQQTMPTSRSSSSSSTSSQVSGSSLLPENSNNTSSHLLAVIYEFERGQGTIDMITMQESLTQEDVIKQEIPQTCETTFLPLDTMV